MGQSFSTEPVVEKETERAENETFKAAVSSCQGWRVSQEDNHSLILELPQSEHKASFFAVYDGHGSALVSKLASEDLWRHLIGNPNFKKGDFKEALEQAFLSFDKEVDENYTPQLAGTTAVCVLIVDNVIYCANIGDSRAVASVNCECEPLSYDHKPDNPDELKRILAAGGYVLGNRVNGNLALSRAFGDFHYKSNDQLEPQDQIVSPCPDIKRIELNDSVDFIVLACDGIWDVLTSEEVVKFVISRLEQGIEPGLICEQLTTKCLATDYELVIGCDNMTVLLVCHTRGRSWSDYCTDIFNKNTEKLGVPRTRSFNPADLEDDTDVHRRRQLQLRQQKQKQEEDDRLNMTLMQSRNDSSSARFPSRESSSTDEYAAYIPKSMEYILEVIQKLGSDEESASTEQTSSSQQPSCITELSSDSSSELKNDQDSAGTSSETPKEIEESNDIGKSGETSKSVGEEQNDGAEDADIATISSKTTEIHLGVPDDDEGETSASDVQETPESDEVISKTVEIELSPDEEAVLEGPPDPIEETVEDDKGTTEVTEADEPDPVDSGGDDA